MKKVVGRKEKFGDTIYGIVLKKVQKLRHFLWKITCEIVETRYNKIRLYTRIRKGEEKCLVLVS